MIEEKAEVNAVGRGGEADEGGGLFRSEWWVLKVGWVGYPGIPFRRWGGVVLWGFGALCATPHPQIFGVRHCTARTAVLVHCCVRGSRASDQDGTRQCW